MSTSDVPAGEALRELLGGPLPPSIAALDEARLAVLLEALHSARQEQRRSLAEATEHGLNFVPRLLRTPVRKVLFG